MAAIVGGALWLVIWAHQMFTHGPTQENEKEILLGLTWMDSAKFLVLPFALFLLAAVAAHRSIERPRTFARVAFFRYSRGASRPRPRDGVWVLAVPMGLIRDDIRRASG